MALCAQCFQKASNKCAKCADKGVLRWYCSAYCQRKDWELGHKGDCGLSDLPEASVPSPPSTLVAASVERPVLSDKEWRSLEEAQAAQLGPRSGYPRGLRNLGNSCYMNAVLQGVFHAAPMLLASCRQHRTKAACACPPSDSGLLKPGEGCFRCDLDSMAFNCLEPCPVLSTDSTESNQQLAWGDIVTIIDPGSSKVGIGEEAFVERVGEENIDVRLHSNQRFSLPIASAKLCCRAATGPVEVARWLPRLGDEFTFGMQEDAHEYLRSLLRLVEHEELKESTEALRKRAAESEATDAPTSLPVNADLTASPSRIFGGMLVSQCTCTIRSCGASSFSFENFMDLSLDITEATDSLEDTLRFFTAPEKLDKKNGFRCATCQEVSRARKQLRIYSAPNCLVLHLKRFRHVAAGQGGKVTKPISFSTKLNMNPFLCAGAPEAGKPLWYELRAVVVHLDKAGFSHFGHYISFVRCSKPGTGASAWYALDDSQTIEVTEEQVLRHEAYMLIYSRASSSTEVPSQPSLRRGVSNTPGVSKDSKEAVLCRGIKGEICSFFSCSDGLCTKCYVEEHGKPPPSPDPEDEPAPLPPQPAPTPAAKPVAKAPAAQPTGKVKKVGANDPCPCGSGNKYKKCHGKSK